MYMVYITCTYFNGNMSSMHEYGINTWTQIWYEYGIMYISCHMYTYMLYNIHAYGIYSIYIPYTAFYEINVSNRYVWGSC